VSRRNAGDGLRFSRYFRGDQVDFTGMWRFTSAA